MSNANGNKDFSLKFLDHSRTLKREAQLAGTSHGYTILLISLGPSDGAYSYCHLSSSLSTTDSQICELSSYMCNDITLHNFNSDLTVVSPKTLRKLLLATKVQASGRLGN